MLPGWVIDPQDDLIYLSSKEQRPGSVHLELNAQTGLPEKETLGTEPEATGAPFWSADGSKYYYYSGSNGALVETKLATGEQRLIRMPDGFTGELGEGSPDGQSFVFWGWKWSEASKTGVLNSFLQRGGPSFSPQPTHKTGCGRLPTARSFFVWHILPQRSGRPFAS